MAYDGFNYPPGIGPKLESIPMIEESFAIVIKEKLGYLADVTVKAVCEVNIYPAHILADIQITGLKELINQYGSGPVKSLFEGTALALKEVSFSTDGDFVFLEFEYAENVKQAEKPAKKLVPQIDELLNFIKNQMGLECGCVVTPDFYRINIIYPESVTDDQEAYLAETFVQFGFHFMAEKTAQKVNDGIMYSYRAVSMDPKAEVSVATFADAVVVDLKSVFAQYGALSNVQIKKEGEKLVVSAVVNEPGGVPDLDLIGQEAGVDLTLKMVDCQVPVDLQKGDIVHYEFVPVEWVTIAPEIIETVKNCVGAVMNLEFMGFHPVTEGQLYNFEVGFDDSISQQSDYIESALDLLRTALEGHGAHASFQQMGNDPKHYLVTIVPFIKELKPTTTKKLSNNWTAEETIAPAVMDMSAMEKIMFAAVDDEVPVDILPDGSVVPSIIYPKCDKCKGKGTTGSGFFVANCEACAGAGVLSPEAMKKVQALKDLKEKFFPSKPHSGFKLAPKAALTFETMVHAAVALLDIKLKAKVEEFDTKGHAHVAIYVKSVKEALEVSEVFEDAGLLPIHQSADVVVSNKGEKYFKHVWIIKPKPKKIEPMILDELSEDISTEVYDKLVGKVLMNKKAEATPAAMAGTKSKAASAAEAFGLTIFDVDEEGNYTFQLSGKAYFLQYAFEEALEALGLTIAFGGASEGPGDTTLYKYWMTTMPEPALGLVESYKVNSEPMFWNAFQKMSFSQWTNFLEIIRKLIRQETKVSSVVPLEFKKISRIGMTTHRVCYQHGHTSDGLFSQDIANDLFVNFIDQALGKVPSDVAQGKIMGVDMASPDGDKTIIAVKKGENIMTIKEEDAPGQMLCTGAVMSALLPKTEYDMYSLKAVASGEIQNASATPMEPLEFSAVLGGIPVKLVKNPSYQGDASIFIGGVPYVVTKIDVKDETPVVQIFSLAGGKKSSTTKHGKKASKLLIEAHSIGYPPEIKPSAQEVYTEFGIKKQTLPPNVKLAENQKLFKADSQINLGSLVYLAGVGKVSAEKNATQVKPVGIAMHSAMKGTQVVVAIGGAMLKGAVQMGKEELAGPEVSNQPSVTVISTDYLSDDKFYSKEEKVYTLAGVGKVVFCPATDVKAMYHIAFVVGDKIIIERTGPFEPGCGIEIDRQMTASGSSIYRMYKISAASDRTLMTETHVVHDPKASKPMDIPQAQPQKYQLCQRPDGGVAFMVGEKEILLLNPLGQVIISGEMFQKKDSVMESMSALAGQFWEVIGQLNPLRMQLFKAAALSEVLKDGANKLEAENLALKEQFKKLHFEYVGKYEERALKPHRQGRFENVADNIVNEEPEPE